MITKLDSLTTMQQHQHRLGAAPLRAPQHAHLAPYSVWKLPSLSKTIATHHHHHHPRPRRRRLQHVVATSSSPSSDKTKREVSNPVYRFLGSAAGAIAAELATLPTDVAKTRLQVLPHYRGMIHCLTLTYQEEGVAALWSGLVPALVRQVCYSSLAMVIYEPVRNAFAAAVGSASGSSDDGEVRQPGFAERLMAGGTAGALAITVFNPTEVIKTQLQSATRPAAAMPATAAAATQQTAPSTMLGVIKHVYRGQGILGFWAGLRPNVARTFLVNAAELGTYDQAKQWFVQRVGDNVLAFMGASLVAGVASACISTPADVVKTRLMNQAGGAGHYTGMIHCALTTVRQEGPLALYKGFTPIVVRKVMWCGVFFVCYEEIRNALVKLEGDAEDA